MSEPFLGEVRLMSFNFPPRGWALCNGQLLPINQNQALFSLLGTQYGGNGQTNFALPDLRGRMPIYWGGGGYTIGEAGGEVAHTVTQQEMPQHAHFVVADDAPGTASPTLTSRLANSTSAQLYGPPNNVVAMNAGAVGPVGGSQAHNNMQPYLVISACIALQGVFPSRN